MRRRRWSRSKNSAASRRRSALSHCHRKAPRDRPAADATALPPPLAGGTRGSAPSRLDRAIAGRCEGNGPRQTIGRQQSRNSPLTALQQANGRHRQRGDDERGRCNRMLRPSESDTDAKDGGQNTLEGNRKNGFGAARHSKSPMRRGGSRRRCGGLPYSINRRRAATVPATSFPLFLAHDLPLPQRPLNGVGGFGRWMETPTTCTRQNAPGFRTGCQDCAVSQPGS